MPEFRILLGRLIAFTLFALGLGYFSSSPSYTYHDPQKALLVVSFSHASERREACRKFTQEELNALAPNMRRPMDCPRQRVPLQLQILLDDEVLLNRAYSPTGLASDGAASVYESIPVAAGVHRITARLRDSGRNEGFDHIASQQVLLAPRQLLVIDFRRELGGFLFK